MVHIKSVYDPYKICTLSIIFIKISIGKNSGILSFFLNFEFKVKLTYSPLVNRTRSGIRNRNFTRVTMRHFNFSSRLMIYHISASYDRYRCWARMTKRGDLNYRFIRGSRLPSLYFSKANISKPREIRGYSPPWVSLVLHPWVFIYRWNLGAKSRGFHNRNYGVTRWCIEMREQ